MQSLLAEAAERAFGQSEDERLLRRVLVRGYLEPAPSQEAAADELHMSRSSYFRRLKAATHRVAEYVRAGDPPETQPGPEWYCAAPGAP